MTVCPARLSEFLDVGIFISISISSLYRALLPKFSTGNESERLSADSRKQDPPPHRRGIPLPLPLNARGAVPGGARGPEDG